MAFFFWKLGSPAPGIRACMVFFFCAALAGCRFGTEELAETWQKSPAVRSIEVTRIQAQSAQEVAHIQAEAQIKMAEIEAEKEKYLAKQKADRDRALTEKAAETERQRQQAESERLSAELKAWRDLHDPRAPLPHPGN